ncbi:MAG: metalloregulator ArsR/SmtB family transcription factor, partial [Gammaproteobacteria bacterium]|nr:metalloregulator ArsR/SmtB family transcription factor [Gammaproteobacteria bacterium]MCW8959845.1 metalloregulator ArsR/SmtB family transcription factor [Gammaproteobacteria bacterium]
MSNYRTISDSLPAMFKALSNPHRLALFRRMLACCSPGTVCPVQGELSVSELAEGLRIAPSTLSHHLKELHQCGLIGMERRGKRVFCRIEPDAVTALAQLFSPPEHQ